MWEWYLPGLNSWRWAVLGTGTRLLPPRVAHHSGSPTLLWGGGGIEVRSFPQFGIFRNLSQFPHFIFFSQFSAISRYSRNFPAIFRNWIWRSLTAIPPRPLPAIERV